LRVTCTLQSCAPVATTVAETMAERQQHRDAVLHSASHHLTDTAHRTLLQRPCRANGPSMLPHDGMAWQPSAESKSCSESSEHAVSTASTYSPSGCTEPNPLAWRGSRSFAQSQCEAYCMPPHAMLPAQVTAQSSCHPGSHPAVHPGSHPAVHPGSHPAVRPGSHPSVRPGSHPGSHQDQLHPLARPVTHTSWCSTRMPPEGSPTGQRPVRSSVVRTTTAASSALAGRSRQAAG